MIAKGFNTITFLMAERAKMWVRAFMSTTFSSVSFYTCPCKSTITKTTEKNIILYFISINILSHHFNKCTNFIRFYFHFLLLLAFDFSKIKTYFFIPMWEFIKDKLHSCQNPWLFQLFVAISHKRSNKVGRINYWLGTSVSDK